MAAMSYKHAEAYCLMTYRSDDETEEEIIWNSRDGVTPFTITLRSGKPARHVNWRDDVRDPDYKPKPGERIFVDLTPERAEEHARRVMSNWEHLPQRELPSLKELTQSYLRDGAPDLIEVQ